MLESLPSFPLLKRLAMQKSKVEQPYEKVRFKDEESFGIFPPAGGRHGASPRAKTRSFLTGVLVVGLMVVCIAATIWWPARIQQQAVQMAGYGHSHQHYPDHPSHHDHSGSAHGLVDLTQSNSPYSPSKESPDTVATCGSTVEEAKALGCKWDGLSMGWIPPACIDPELTEDFENQGPFSYYADRQGEEPLALDELPYRVGEGKEIYTSLRFHKLHCSYQWRKMHRAMLRGGKVENKLADYHHTMHCGFVQMQEGEMEDLLTKITVELMEC